MDRVGRLFPYAAYVNTNNQSTTTTELPMHILELESSDHSSKLALECFSSKIPCLPWNIEDIANATNNSPVTGKISYVGVIYPKIGSTDP